MRTSYLLTFLACLLFSNCLDKFDFERPDSIKDAIAIQGRIAKGTPSTVRVIVREVFDFANFPKFLSASEVLIIDEAGNQLELESRRQGFYNLTIPDDHPFFKVATGNKYKIRVSGLKNKIFESSWEELLPVPIPEKLVTNNVEMEVTNRFGIVQTFRELGYFIDTPLSAPNSSKNSRILWELDGTFKLTDTPSAGRCFAGNAPAPKSCYITDSPVKNYITFDGTKSSATRLDSFLIASINFTGNLAEGYYINILQQSLTEGAYDYWSQVSTAVNRTGDLFQQPTGLVTNNLQNIDDPNESVFGYFYATEEQPIRLYIEPRGMPSCPITSEDGTVAGFCCDCRRIGTPIKPDWWVE